jgi:hypothetical protein
MTDWPEVVTPSDIAAWLRLGGERPDKVVRAWLREIYPKHVRFQRWEFTPSEGDTLVERWRNERQS